MPESLDAKFAALADPVRREIVQRLAQGELTLSELAEPLPISTPAVFKHLRTLERAGLVQRGPRTSVRPIFLAPGGLDELSDWVDRNRRFWQASFHRLEAIVSRRNPVE